MYHGIMSEVKRIDWAGDEDLLIKLTVDGDQTYIINNAIVACCSIGAEDRTLVTYNTARKKYYDRNLTCNNQTDRTNDYIPDGYSLDAAPWYYKTSYRNIDVNSMEIRQKYRNIYDLSGVHVKRFKKKLGSNVDIKGSSTIQGSVSIQGTLSSQGPVNFPSGGSISGYD